MVNFTPEEKYDKIDVRCPYCNRLWFKAFVFETTTPVYAMAMEIKCPNCSKIVAWPILTLPE